MDGGDNGYYSGKEKRDRLGIASGLPQENIYDPSPNTYEEYLRRKALPQIKEIMRKYPDIKFIWFDVDKNLPENVAFEFYKTCYDINPKVLMNRRIGYSFADYVDAGDNGIPKSVNEMVKPWETIGTTNNSWGYASYDQDWKSPAEILYWLVEVASKGGNYMLNIGPEGDGSVPSKCVKNMQIVGKWMHINGEAIYGTKSWISTFEGTYQGVMEGTEDRKLKGFNANFGEGDFWFTQKDDAVYAIAMKYPSGKGVVNAFAQGKVKIKEAFVLGACASFHWEQSEKGLEFILNEKPNELGYTIKVIIQ
jgi:alpha-L-fucosidase